MPRLVRRLLVAVVVVALLGGAAALLLTGRARLDAARDDAEAAWTPLREPLAARYAVVAAYAEALRAAGAGDRDAVVELADALARWNDLADDPEPDVAAQVDVANRIEGLVARADATVAGSERLSATPEVVGARDAVAGATVPAAAVQAYNDAARAYDDARHAVLRRPVVAVFGFESLPALPIDALAP